MLATIQGDQDTAAADPSQSSVLHGAGTEGTGQSCSFCPDVAHIREVHTTRHWWVAQTQMGGQTRRTYSDWGEGRRRGRLLASVTGSGAPLTGLLRLWKLFSEAALPTACLSVTCLPSRAGRLPGAGAGGRRGFTTRAVGNPDRHQRTQRGAQEPGVCDPSRGDPRYWPAGEQSLCLLWGLSLGWVAGAQVLRAKYSSCSHSSLTLLPAASLSSWMHTPWRIRV